jgi:hypothetical protein
MYKFWNSIKTYWAHIQVHSDRFIWNSTLMSNELNIIIEMCIVSEYSFFVLVRFFRINSISNHIILAVFISSSLVHQPRVVFEIWKRIFIRFSYLVFRFSTGRRSGIFLISGNDPWVNANSHNNHAEMFWRESENGMDFAPDKKIQNFYFTRSCRKNKYYVRLSFQFTQGRNAIVRNRRGMKICFEICIIRGI